MSDNNTGIKPPTKPPNCLKCAHFRTVLETKYPIGATMLRACDMFSIKCSNFPSHEVFRATGANCPSFQLKERLKN